MVPEVSLTGLVVVAAVAFAAPMLLGLAPRLRLPAVVLEILAGIAIGPSGLNWVQPDVAIEVLGLLGLAMLLFLAGMEIEPERFRGRLLKVALVGFVTSIVAGLALGLALRTIGFVGSPILFAIALSATSLGLVIPVLKDSRQAETQLGQLVISASSIADFGAVILLSLLFSGEGSGPGATVILLGGFAMLAVVIGLALAGAGRSMRISQTLLRLQDTTAEIRVRGAILLMVGFAALAEGLGLEVILAAFIAGAVLKLVDRDVMLTHPNFRLKLEAIGYGFVIPVFFVSSGLRFDAAALFESASSLARVPVFLAALLLVRGLPALAYRSIVGRRGALAAALLQATSLPFIVAATQIGLELGAVSETNAAALVGAGLLSVIVFPLSALGILKGTMPAQPSETVPA
ncbi:MAG TPA: cation:proton antiporter [Actinomycetota bacterium]|nr:cation:proton antiporter [Actinomycetota bacterium]